jgi:hypothetical protein
MSWTSIATRRLARAAALTIVVVAAQPTLAGCGSSIPPRATASAPATARCSDGSGLRGRYHGPGSDTSARKLTQVSSGDLAGSIATSGDTVLIARRAADAVVLTRLDGTTGGTLETARFTVAQISPSTDPSTVSFVDSPAVLATDDGIFLVWETVDSSGRQHNSTVLAIDPCRLALRATRLLQADVSPSLQQDSVAFAGHRLWIANALKGNRVSAFDSRTLAEVAGGDIVNARSVVTTPDRVWESGDSLALLTTTGAVTRVHPYGDGQSTVVMPAYSVGGRLFVADQRQLIEFDPDTGELLTTHAGASSNLAALDGKVWTLTGDGGDLSVATVPVAGAAIPVNSAAVSINPLQMVATIGNLWAIDFTGGVWVY